MYEYWVFSGIVMYLVAFIYPPITRKRYNKLALELPVVCLPLCYKRIPLSALFNGTISKLASLFSSLSSMLNVNQGICK